MPARRKKTTKKSGKAAGGPDDDPPTDSDEPLSEIFWSHPLIKRGKFFFFPYILWTAHFYLRLKHPEYVSTATAGLINLRSAVGVGDPRQVLILASPSSATNQMAKELSSKFGLEIGKETSDSETYFVRDGTVSWFRGIRFLNTPDSDKVKSFIDICQEEQMNMGFHPNSYRIPVNSCSNKKIWDECWQKECMLTLVKEWSCATQNNPKPCEINFEHVIHQVRNPLRTIESLVFNFCEGEMQGEVASSFLVYASALFPHHNFYENSCIEAAGYFLVEYQTALIEARKRDEIKAFYRIEDSSACDVAKLAGFMNSETALYAPNQVRIAEKCGNSSSNARTVIEEKENSLKLGWKDLHGGMHGSMKKEGDKDLEKKVRVLFHEFGYNVTAELDEAPYVDPLSSQEL